MGFYCFRRRGWEPLSLQDATDVSPDSSRIGGNWMLRLLDGGGWFLNFRFKI